MLPEFINHVFQLPLISSTWIYAQNRYEQKKKDSSLPIRLTLIAVEQTTSLVCRHIIRPLLEPCHARFHNVDHFLCSHIDTVRAVCPILDETKDQILDRYGQQFFFYSSTSNQKSKSFLINKNVKQQQQVTKTVFQNYFGLITNILMFVEFYSKHIKHELTDRIGTIRNLWKTLNMEDGRSLDAVENYLPGEFTFSEKLLVLGRRMIGNYRQLVYLGRYQFKRLRRLLLSLINVQHRFRSTVWRAFQKTQLNSMNQMVNDRARRGLLTSKERVSHYLDMMMLYAAKHPWMRWRIPQPTKSTKKQISKPLKSVPPMFFVSSNNTSDRSETDDGPIEKCRKIVESTPIQKMYRNPRLSHSRQEIEDFISDISSSSSDEQEQSFDVKDILRQVDSQSQQTMETNDSTLLDRENENRILQEALNASDDEQQQPVPVSVFDLSPMLASGCAV